MAFISQSDTAGSSRMSQGQGSTATFQTGRTSNVQGSTMSSGGFGWVGVASAIGSSITNLYAAKAARAVAKYNQGLYDIQAGVIRANNEWQKKQYAEARKITMGRGIATLATQNVGLTGRTSLSLLNKSMQNLYLDEAISDYNAKIAENQARSSGVMAKIEGKAQASAYNAQAIGSFGQGLASASSMKGGK